MKPTKLKPEPNLKQAMIDLEHENMQRSDVAKAVNKITPLFGQIEAALTDISEWPRGNFLLQEFLNFKCECEVMTE